MKEKLFQERQIHDAAWDGSRQFVSRNEELFQSKQIAHLIWERASDIVGSLKMKEDLMLGDV